MVSVLYSIYHEICSSGFCVFKGQDIHPAYGISPEISSYTEFQIFTEMKGDGLCCLYSKDRAVGAEKLCLSGKQEERERNEL